MTNDEARERINKLQEKKLETQRLRVNARELLRELNMHMLTIRQELRELRLTLPEEEK